MHSNIINLISASGGGGSTLNSYIIISGRYMNNEFLKLPVSGSLTNTSLNINGMIYTSGSYSLILSNTYSIKWNNITQNYGGFNLNDRDTIIFQYYEG
jgi:hypothetical protein